MKNLYLIGDSIRMNYQPRVTELLSDKAKIFCPGAGETNENARFSAYTLNNLVPHMWLSDFPKIDVIHWNNGIWDAVTRFPEDGPFTPLDEYERNMRRILRELKKMTPNIVFATTTPPKVDVKYIPDTKRISLRIEDIQTVNEVALKIMKENDVKIDDLYTLVYNNRDRYICDDLIHLSPEGIEACAKSVVASVEKCL